MEINLGFKEKCTSHCNRAVILRQTEALSNEITDSKCPTLRSKENFSRNVSDDFTGSNKCKHVYFFTVDLIYQYLNIGKPRNC